MSTRVAVIAIIIEDLSAVADGNSLPDEGDQSDQRSH